MVVEVMGPTRSWVGSRGAGAAPTDHHSEFPLTSRMSSPPLPAPGQGKLSASSSSRRGRISQSSRTRRVGRDTDAFGHCTAASAASATAARMVNARTGFERADRARPSPARGSPTPTDRIWANRLGVHAVGVDQRRQSGVIQSAGMAMWRFVPLARSSARRAVCPRS